jgi:hypothetical protein
VPKSFAKYVRVIETCLITSECIKNLKLLSIGVVQGKYIIFNALCFPAASCTRDKS